MGGCDQKGKGTGRRQQAKRWSNNKPSSNMRCTLKVSWTQFHCGWTLRVHHFCFQKMLLGRTKSKNHHATRRKLRPGRRRARSLASAEPVYQLLLETPNSQPCERCTCKGKGSEVRRLIGELKLDGVGQFVGKEQNCNG